MGRPSSYTEERANEVVRYIAGGGTKDVAAQAVGVTAETVNNWAKRNSSFSTRLKAAEAQFELNHLARIGVAAAAGTWQASAWLLERTRGERYAARQKVDNTHSGKDGGPVPTHTTITFRRLEPTARADQEEADEKDTTPNGTEDET
jgi:transposase